MQAPRFVIESHNESATLYVRASVRRADMRDLRIAFALLPVSVRALRIDASPMRDLGAPTARLLREAGKHWRRTRGGRVDWCASARIRQARSVSPGSTGSAFADILPRDPALSAVFL